MTKKLSLIKQHQRKIIYALILLASATAGLVITYATFRNDLGMGDNSTFYTFARNLVNGEVYYRDFIHFRTPGTVTMFSIFMRIFGEQQSTIEIGTRLETLVLYPLLFLISGMIIYRKKNPLYILVAFLGVVFLPGVAQLRAGFGLLAVAVYIASLEAKRHQLRYLFIVGILIGITFIFGQEVALMSALCIGANELIGQKFDKVFWNRIKVMALGAVVGILPLLIYVVINSSIVNFLYYTFYYSFVLQPKFMDLPFPEFAYSSLIYYLPFFMYAICFLILFTNKKLGKMEALLLSFGVLRLITALGRSDFGHLVFAIPEVFLIVPYFFMNAKDAVINKTSLRAFAPYGVTLIGLFYLAMISSSIFIALTPFVIMFALSKRSTNTAGKFSFNGALYTSLALGAGFIMFVYILFPTYFAIVKDVKRSLANRNAPAYYVGGVKTDAVNYQQIKDVEAAVKPLNPKTIFAFPIQPFYYSMADKHAARFMTFEPQTTLKEQQQTIEDLKRTKPEVIIFDPLQAQGLSGSLAEISEYIMTNYEIHKEVSHREILWVMTPKQEPSHEDKLVFQLYTDNPNKKDSSGIQNSATNLQNAILQNANSIRFIIGPRDSDDTLEVSVAQTDGLADCGVVLVRYNANDVNRVPVCATDNEVKIPLKAHDGKLEIVFEKTSAAPIVWNDAEIVE